MLFCMLIAEWNVGTFNLSIMIEMLGTMSPGVSGHVVILCQKLSLLFRARARAYCDTCVCSVLGGLSWFMD